MAVIITFGCNSSKNDVTTEAREINNQAMVLFKNNLLNNDSIRFSLALLDSAIFLQPSYIDFYYNKIEVLASINDNIKALRTADDILTRDSTQFNAYVIKGDLYEAEGKKDSAKYWYTFALNTIEKYDLMRNSKMIRDVQVIKIFSKLGDSSNYNKQLIKFKQDYSHDPSYQEYLDAIKK